MGNLLLEEDVFSTELEHTMRRDKAFKHGKIAVINTSDLLHPNMTQRQLTQEVARCVRLCYPGPHVFLLVLQPADFTEGAQTKLCKILDDLSDQWFDHSLLLISAPGQKDPGVTDSYMEHPPLKAMIRTCQYRYLKLENLDRLELLTRLGQVVKENRGEHVSCDVFEGPSSSAATAPQSLKPDKRKSSVGAVQDAGKYRTISDPEK